MSNADLSRLEAMMAEVPGGSYMMMMLRNNPQAMEALASIDPSDPNSMERSMHVLLGAFGIGGSQATMMVDQMKQMLNDPAAMDRMSSMMDKGTAVDDGGDPFGAAATDTDAPSNVVPFPSASATPTRRTGPVWQGAMAELESWLDQGNLRRAFERFHAILDDESLASWDPTAPDSEELIDLLAMYTRTAHQEGRQIPLRFAEHYRRLAVARRPTDFQPPTANPAYSEWCLLLMEHLG